MVEVSSAGVLIQSRKERAREWKGSVATFSRPGWVSMGRKRIVVGPWVVCASELLLQVGVLEGLAAFETERSRCSSKRRGPRRLQRLLCGRACGRSGNKERGGTLCLVVSRTV
jgi:hypothetical protein